MNLRPDPQNNFGLESRKELIKWKQWNPRKWYFCFFSCTLTPRALKTLRCSWAFWAVLFTLTVLCLTKHLRRISFFLYLPKVFIWLLTHSHVERGCAHYTTIVSCKKEIQSWKQEQDQLLITKLQCHSFLLCFPVSMGLELNPAQLYMGFFLVETALCTWTLPGHEKTGLNSFMTWKRKNIRFFALCKRSALTSSALFWPLKNSNIENNFTHREKNLI